MEGAWEIAYSSCGLLVHCEIWMLFNLVGIF